MLHSLLVRPAHVLGEPIVAHALHARILDLERVAQGAALGVVEAGDGDEAVLRFVDAVVVVAAPAGDVLRAQFGNLRETQPAFLRLLIRLAKSFSRRPIAFFDREQRPVLRRQAGGEEARLDALAAAGLRASVERVDDGERHKHACRQIGDSDGGDELRRAALQLVLVEDHAGRRLREDVVARAAAVRPFPAECRVLAVDERRVAGGERVIVQPQPFGDAGTIVDDDDVRASRQLLGDHTALLAAEVEGDAALAAINAQEAAALVRSDRGRVAPGIALGPFDFDDVCPHIGEHHGGVRPRDVLCEVDDADA